MNPPAPTVAQLAARREALMRELAMVEEMLRRAKSPAAAPPQHAKAPATPAIDHMAEAKKAMQARDWQSVAAHAKQLAKAGRK